MRHINIPIFIPHLGCPNQCVFCNQRTISGVNDFDIQSVEKNIIDVLNTVTEDAEIEIAFFGGSFTGIDRTLMVNLLKIAKKFVDCGRVQSIRCSTRPDYISEEILDILVEYGVKVVELGLQSVSDNVLLLTKRGHNFEAELKAVRLITEKGLDLVGQMMIGLPGATLEDEIATAEFIINSGAKFARIYPTIVFYDTELCEMVKTNCYTPLGVEKAVERSAAVFARFVDAGVNVVRIGLCSSENLMSETTYFAGPNHAAIGELVLNRYFLNILEQKIDSISPQVGAVLKIYHPRGARSKIAGQKNRNKILLINKYALTDIIFEEKDGLSEYDVKVTEER